MNLRALQESFRDWLVHESPALAARLGAGAKPGLAVYLNTYRGQLIDCLAQTYTVLHAWLGDAAFEAAAATHVDRVPPGSWTLDAYGLGFPDTLGLLYADDPEVTELACLERALAEAFTGPDCAVVDTAALGAIEWDQARLALVPTFTLLPATTNAAAIWTAVSGDASPPPAATLEVPTQIAVWRLDFTPRFRTLELAEAQALELVADGMSFGALCALLAGRHGDDAGAARAGAWLGQWLQDGIIARVHQGSDAPS